jgi:UDPglucose--hexose-1-phosphate uridylyltransferase
MTQLRRDPIRGHWTIIAPGRMSRPQDFKVEVVEPPKNGPCPFCPGNERLTPPEVESVRPVPSAADSPGWVVRVIPNRFAALSLTDGADETLLQDAGELLRSQPGVGAHEIVIATPEHHRRAANFSVDHWDTVLATCQYRMDQLSRDPRVKQLLLFENHGAQSGASKSHAHLQIMGLPMAASASQQRLVNARTHFQRHGRCLICDVVAKELDAGQRVVVADDAFVAFAPWASRLPFELCVLPRPHHASFLKVPPAERRRLAAHLRDVLSGLETLFGDLPYNWMLHTAPIHEEEPRALHWHIEILPRLGPVGGYEWATGSYINTVAPEEAAAQLRALRGA